MPKPEGLSLRFDKQDAIRPDLLEAMAYHGQPQEIQIKTNEFSAVCPFSGLPDLASLEIIYFPSNRIVELKSFKYYLVSFRQVGIYQEEVTDRIARDLWELLSPHYLCVTTIYATRGGIDTRSTIERGRKPTLSTL